MNPDSKQCLACGKSIRGRTDKKFCDDYCRSKYNNKRLHGIPVQVKDINKALLNNWRILDSVFQNTNSIRILRENLLREGFQFKYFTHIQKQREGEVFFCCYNYRYTTEEEESILIARQ